MNVDEILDKERVVDELAAVLKEAERTQSWAAKQLKKTKAYMSRVFTKQAEPSLDLVIDMKRLADKTRSFEMKKSP